jgi:hypothetical protein
MPMKPTQKTKLAQFLKAITEKNYAQAHKYLKSVINEKIALRINKAIEKI